MNRQNLSSLLLVGPVLFLLNQSTTLAQSGSSETAKPSVVETETTDQEADSTQSETDVKTDSKAESDPTKQEPAKQVKQSLPMPVVNNNAKNNKDKKFLLSFDDLAFEMEKTETFKRSMLTPQINGYDGATVSLQGYIRPSFRQTGLKQFVFVRDNKECCFGPGAALYDCVLVKLAKGKETDYTVRPVTIEGEFMLKEYKGPDGNIWSIYRLKNGHVK